VNRFVRVARHEQLRDEPGPARLMGSADPAPAVAMEVLVEQHVILEVRIALHARMMAEYGTLPVLIFEEDARQSRRELVRHLVDGHEAARACRTFDAELVPVLVMELLL
jgi:hypothetical protein